MGGRWVQTIDGRYICRNLYVILCILYIYTYIYYSYSYLCVWFKPILDLIQKTTSSLYHGGISWTSSVISIHFMSSVLPRWYVIVTPNIKNTHACVYIYTYNIMILHLYIHPCLWLGVDTQLCPICLHWSSFQQPCRRQGLQVLPSIYCISYSGKF